MCAHVEETLLCAQTDRISQNSKVVSTIVRIMCDKKVQHDF